MAAYLITGNPGAGKTAMTAELIRRGQRALDIDDIAGWVDASGAPARQPDIVTAIFLSSHYWVWTRAALERVIGAVGTEPLFLCGIAINQGEMLDLFDLTFLLAIDAPTQIERLNTVNNADRNAAQRAQITEGRPVFQEKMRRSGAVILDGRLPTSTLATAVLRTVSAQARPTD